jgi:hypothetical protein
LKTKTNTEYEEQQTQIQQRKNHHIALNMPGQQPQDTNDKNNQTTQGHRVILAAQSLFFRQLLLDEMKKQKQKS